MGNPGMEPCATEDAALEGFFEKCLEPDFEPWRAYAPLALSVVRTFIQTFVQEREWTAQSFVLIKDDKCGVLRQTCGRLAWHTSVKLARARIRYDGVRERGAAHHAGS